MIMSEGLGLLQNLISSPLIADDVNDSAGCSNFFNFEDFEDDLDFINQHLEDGEDPHQTDDTRAINAIERIEEERDCPSYESSTSPKTCEKTFEVKYSEETFKAKSIEETFETKSSQKGVISPNGYKESHKAKERQSKKVTFNLPDISEYSDDFESFSEEEIEEEIYSDKSCEVLNEEYKVHDIDQEPCNDQVVNEPNTSVEIKTCSTCNCRLTRMHILDITDLNNLFHAQNTKGKRKARKNKTPNNRKTMKNGLHRYDEKFDDKNINDVKQTKKPPLDNFWSKSSNSSLLSWLKAKKKEERIKRSAKKKEKKEQKLARRLEELARLNRKEISDRKVLEWVRRKKRENLGKYFDGKVTPLSDDYLVKDTSAPPNGYVIVDSFEKKNDQHWDKEEPTMEGKQRKKSGNKGKRAVTFKKIQHNAATIASSEDTKIQSKNGPRKSYDEWLKEKKASSALIKAKHEDKNAHDDGKLYVKERKRRQEIKNTSRKKVDSSWTSKAHRTSNENLALKQHKSGQAEGSQKQYRWAEKLSNPDSHEPSKLKLHDDESLHKSTASDIKLVDFASESEIDITNALRSTKIEEVA